VSAHRDALGELGLLLRSIAAGSTRDVLTDLKGELLVQLDHVGPPNDVLRGILFSEGVDERRDRVTVGGVRRGNDDLVDKLGVQIDREMRLIALEAPGLGGASSSTVEITRSRATFLAIRKTPSSPSCVLVGHGELRCSFASPMSSSPSSADSAARQPHTRSSTNSSRALGRPSRTAACLAPCSVVAPQRVPHLLGELGQAQVIEHGEELSDDGPDLGDGVLGGDGIGGSGG
jgi:hypothetical protein